MDNTLKQAHERIVSFDTESLYLVDSQDNVIGELDKGSCHDGEGILHRAFSLFILNAKGELLLQQRHASKRLWPGFWANTCCSHPRVGEDMQQATERRLYEELGMQASTQYAYKFEYQASFGDAGAEHELCWVYVGKSEDKVAPNPSEIAAWRYITPAKLDEEIARHPEQFTPWLKMEWQRLRQDFNHLLQV